MKHLIMGKIRGLFVCLLGLVLELYIVGMCTYNNNIRYKSSKKARSLTHLSMALLMWDRPNSHGANGIGVAWMIAPGGVVLQRMSVGKLPRSTFLKQKGNLEG
jgi:hypothetical protein